MRAGRLEQYDLKPNQTRHCEHSEAIQENEGALRSLDCFVAIARRKTGVFDTLWLLAMTAAAHLGHIML